VERNIAAGEMGHRGRPFVRHPLVVFAVVPRGVSGCPIVCQVLKKLQAQVRRTRVEGQHVTIGIVGILLMPDTFA